MVEFTGSFGNVENKPCYGRIYPSINLQEKWSKDKTDKIKKRNMYKLIVVFLLTNWWDELECVE